MRLTNLKLRNFRSYEALDLPFTADRTLIIGENGVGKSTITDAIALALTGRCRGVNGKGEGQKDLIRGQADEAEISLTVEGLGTITRTISRVHGANTSLPVDHIMGVLRSTPAYVQAAIYGGSFFEMDHAEAKALLLRLLDVMVVLPGRTPTEPGQGLSLDEADLKYKAAFDQRTSLKRSLAAMPAPAPPAAPSWLNDADERREDHELRLAVDIRSARVTYEAAVALTADVRAEARQLAERLRGLDQYPEDDHQRALAIARAQLSDAQEAEAAAKADLAAALAMPAEATDTLAANINELRVFVQRIEQNAPSGPEPKKPGRPKKIDPTAKPAAATCVLGCGIPCLTPAAEFQAALTSTKRQIEDLEARLKQGNERATAVAVAQRQLTTAETSLKRYQAAIDNAEAAMRSEARRQTDLAEVQAKLADIGPKAEAAQKDVDTKLAALDALRQKETELAVYHRGLDAQATVLKQRAAMEADLAEAERIVGLLGPKGLKLKALEDALGEFHEAINASLEPFGFSLAIDVDPWRVMVIHGTTARPLPFELLSKGQRLWTGLAFQLALAAVSELDFCVIDDAEGVVGEARGKLTDVALDAPVGQVLIVKAQAEDEPAPDLPGLQVVRIGQPVMAAF